MITFKQLRVCDMIVVPKEPTDCKFTMLKSRQGSSDDNKLCDFSFLKEADGVEAYDRAMRGI